MILRTLILCLTALIPTVAHSQHTTPITVLSGSDRSSHTRMAADISRVIEDVSGLRILPSLTQGSLQNLDHLMRTKTHQIAFVNSDAMLSRRLQTPDDRALDQVTYIARLFTNELHVIARTRSQIKTLSDLNGLRVAAGEALSGTFLTTSLILRSSGIDATTIALPENRSLKALRDGAVDAVFVLAGKPSPWVRAIEKDAGLSFVNVPLSNQLASVYGSAKLTRNEYPNLITSPVQTISVDVILAAYDLPNPDKTWDTALTRFTRTLMDTRPQLNAPPSHPKWQEFNIQTTVRGWQRHPIVAQVLTDTNQDSSK